MIRKGALNGKPERKESRASRAKIKPKMTLKMTPKLVNMNQQRSLSKTWKTKVLLGALSHRWRLYLKSAAAGMARAARLFALVWCAFVGGIGGENRRRPGQKWSIACLGSHHLVPRQLKLLYRLSWATQREILWRPKKQLGARKTQFTDKLWTHYKL